MSAHVVYFVQAGEGGPIKIGTTDNLRERLGALQTAHYETLRVIGTIVGGVDIEAAWHGRFSRARIRGEWFKPTAALLAAIVAETAPGPTAPTVSPEDVRADVQRALDTFLAGDEAEARRIMAASVARCEAVKRSPFRAPRAPSRPS